MTLTIKHALSALIGAAITLSACATPALAEDVVKAPNAKLAASEKGMKTAVFAGGCFWGVEGVFSHVKGVTSAVSGYAGGAASTATYSRVTDGDTGHAEAVKVTYNPKLIRYDQLLRIFFSVINDPTLLNRQGPDRGTQYRSALFPQSAEQARVANAYIAQLEAAKLWNRPIVTKIESGQAFYKAEDNHQDFMLKNPSHGYIVRWDAPKVAALKDMYPGIWQSRFTPG